MPLIRTKSGLSNKFLFYGVDCVAYVEGGKISYSVEDVAKGGFSITSDDINFWQKIFSKFLPKKKIKFCAVGSKSSILPFAEGICDGSIKNSVVAMDRDYDIFLGNVFKHPHVFYTYGYSWENDVFSERIINDAIKDISCVSDVDYKEKNNVTVLLDRFCKQIRPAIFFDILLSMNDDSFIPRNPSGGGIININGPSIDLSIIRLLSREKKETIKARPERKIADRIEPKRDSYGHLFCFYCVNIVKNTVKKICGKSVSKDTILLVVLEKFSNFIQLEKGDKTQEHYKNQFLRPNLFV